MSSIAYTKGYKYQLQAPAGFQLALVRPERTITTDWVTLTTEGELSVRHGYAWDGCSGPTWDGPKTMRGSLVHDVLYQLIRLEQLDKAWKADADEEFRRLLVEDGVMRFRANYFHWGVKRFGRGSTLPSRRRKVLFAP